MCERHAAFPYGDGLVFVGEGAALRLQFSILLMQQQLQPLQLHLFLLNAAELFIQCFLCRQRKLKFTLLNEFA